MIAVFCDAITAVHLFGSYRNESKGQEWVRFLDGKGELALDGAGELFLDAVPQGMEGYTDDVQFEPGGQVNLVAVGAEREIAAVFTIPGGGLPTTAWLHPNGDTTKSACETDP